MTTTTDTIATPDRPRAADVNIPKEGASFGVSFAEYVAWDAVNWHTIEPGRKSMKHLRQSLVAPRDANEGMIKGSAIDCLIFETPETFESTYCAMPTFAGHPNSNAHKSAKAEWEESHRQFVHLTRSEMAETMGMYEALKADPIAWALLSGGRGRNQLSLCWHDEKTGMLCKGRLDRLATVPTRLLDPSAPAEAQTVCMIDLKSTREPGVGTNEFQREVQSFGYHGQLAFYRSGADAIYLRNHPGVKVAPDLVPIIVSVGNAAPFDVVVHRLDAECSDGATTIEHGHRLWRRLLDSYAAAKERNLWPGSSGGAINRLTLSPWAMEGENYDC